MIALQLKTNTGAIWRAYYSGTYSNAVEHYLGLTVTNNETITEVFEIPTTEPEPYYEQQ